MGLQIINMEDGGQFGGWVVIAWFFQKQLSITKSSHIEIVKTLQCPCWSPMPLLLLQIWVKGKVYEIGSSGIKQSKRASC
ncbi:Uncharacterized protein TCM_015031 [Theobroma cacao]|uniref:Uncharacterized protein n=1 Tax=Theobroma cacao TaxID=3641 RepID=A0A061G0T9_THECC|nr:Uncharacterized protein TCM_015031 [Theobroma cacao]